MQKQITITKSSDGEYKFTKLVNLKDGAVNTIIEGDEKKVLQVTLGIPVDQEFVNSLSDRYTSIEVIIQAG